MTTTKLSVMFSGQGAQTPGMGKDLYETSPAAKNIFEQANRVLKRDITGLCFDGTMEELTACINCQPAIFTMSQACYAALRERIGDVCPIAAAGLSLGEYSALVAAGVLSFDHALQLVAKRGELMDQACQLTKGSMAAVLGGDSACIEAICSECDVDIANFNCPGQIVISGAEEKVSQAVDKLSSAGYRVVILQVAGAYHSRLMQSAADAFEAPLAHVPFHAPHCKIAQNVIGDFVSSPSELRANLPRQISGSVRWESCLRHMMAESDILLECGPGSTLCGFVKRTDRTYRALPVNSVNTLSAAVEAIQSL